MQGLMHPWQMACLAVAVHRTSWHDLTCRWWLVGDEVPRGGAGLVALPMHSARCPLTRGSCVRESGSDTHHGRVQRALLRATHTFTWFVFSNSWKYWFNLYTVEWLVASTHKFREPCPWSAACWAVPFPAVLEGALAESEMLVVIARPYICAYSCSHSLDSSRHYCPSRSHCNGCSCIWRSSLALFSSQKTLQKFSDSPSHRIFRHIHEVLNIDKNKN